MCATGMQVQGNIDIIDEWPLKVIIVVIQVFGDAYPG